jgi:hypothetical protein
MKKLYKLFLILMLALGMSAETLMAQAVPTPVKVRDLHFYETTPESQADLPSHPLNGQLVTFDAVVVSYPKNSGLANITDAGLPGRIHVFVADVNAITEGRDGMYLQFVHGGNLRETLQDLFVGDVIRIVGTLTFFGNVSQFNPSDVELLGSVTTDTQFENLAPLLEPEVLPLSAVNLPSPVVAGAHRWNPEGYAKYNHSYVKFEGLEVIGRTENQTGRPWLALTDGTSIIYTTDTSLRFRNDRGSSYGNNLAYNYRRLAANLDGPYTPPPPGAIVDISGYMVVNTFNPAGLDEVAVQSTMKIAPWDDGIVWTADGTDTNFRFTEGIRNDMVVLGFASLVEIVAADTDTEVTNAQRAKVTFTVDLPEDTYTLDRVSIVYRALGFNDTTAEEVEVVLTPQNGRYSYEFAAYPDFTNISYTLKAEALTPANVRTVGRATGTVFVKNDDVTVPPTFTQPSGTYRNSVTVGMSSRSTGALIYYTTDGTEPTTDSRIYAGSPLSFDKTTTLKAFAVLSGKQASPVATRQYVIEVDATEVSTLRALRMSPQDATEYLYTGEAVVTYTRTGRNQKYLMDSSGGILIDDAPGIISSPYAIGDVMTNLLVGLTAFNQTVQANPRTNPGNPSGTKAVQPMVVTLAELNVADHESALVTINNAQFVNASGDFAGATNYQIRDASLAEDAFVLLRTNFAESNYLTTPIPTSTVNITALVQNFNGTLQLVPRFLDDFNTDVSVDGSDLAYEFRLNQNFPNPFNPTTSINYTIAEVANVNLTVYDILGRRISVLVNEMQSPGQYHINFDASRLASGTYIYRLEAGGQVSIKKMMFIK